MAQMSSLEALIQAAQFIESNGHEEELEEEEEEETRLRKRNHRYRVKKPSTYSRTTHNLLEKNRRAQLRDCLEVLRQHVPLPDKLTTLALLQSAKKYIESLQQKEQEENELKRKLHKEQAYLLERLAELGASNPLQTLANCSTTRSKAVQTTSPSPPYSPARKYSPPLDVDSLPLGRSPGSPSSSSSSLSPSTPNHHPPHSGTLSGGGEGMDDEEMVIDVTSHESEDEASSTTSGSDGGTTCTSSNRKYEIAV